MAPAPPAPRLGVAGTEDGWTSDVERLRAQIGPNTMFLRDGVFVAGSPDGGVLFGVYSPDGRWTFTGQLDRDTLLDMAAKAGRKMARLELPEFARRAAAKHAAAMRATAERAAVERASPPRVLPLRRARRAPRRAGVRRVARRLTAKTQAGDGDPDPSSDDVAEGSPARLARLRRGGTS
jgi:hypothetical protein